MTKFFLSATALTLAGCGPAVSYSAGADGWTYVNAPGIQPTLSHDLSPAPGRFIGTCDDTPTFLIMEADWNAGAKRLTVAADGKTMGFDATFGQSSHSLPMLPEGTTGSTEEAANQKLMEAMLASARSPIVITTDNGWTRSVPASLAIGKFIATCYDWRKTHPAPK